ncbi:ABC transporter substrate-binding protein [Dechloromonas sp. HYN0024]|uniref:ABC transporter substrate-binding protein n=1 Tax=Dechloromonas sp. HYN0024 TaxID=2231055 RepID=UPI0013C2B704|nr:ABC transporter substrate binding protein [Dechloromonas sp. HYN0024]
MAVFIGGQINPATAAEFKVLVVMSYEADNPWVKEIREGIDAVLGSTSEITYFHMNTKVAPAGGPQKGEEAYALYQSLQPDGVIAADDDAQSMFVVPFLKDKVKTPVMFNGVNNSAAKYGFPATNVSGILERAHVRESLAFAKQLIPTLGNVCLMTNDVPAGRALKAQVEEERQSYPVKVGAFHLVKSVREIEAAFKGGRPVCDSLLVDSLEGIVSDAATPLDNKGALTALSKVYGGPVLAGNRYQVDQGAWAAVVKTGQEQGETSAEMLLKAMRGTPVAKIPVVWNVKGQRVINVTAIEGHQLGLRPTVLRGATLVRQQP